jgi:hypothetical protein
MRFFNIISVLFLAGVLSVCNGQTDSGNALYDIENLFTRLVNSKIDSDKIRINDSIIHYIDSYATSDTVFNHNFHELRYLGQISYQKSYLKILTWNLLLTDSPSRYYSYFIFRPRNKNIVTKLSGEYSENPLRTDTIYSSSDWYGALYYDLRPYRINNENYWILLGIDYGNPMITRKIIDVVSFASDSSIVFGKQLFKYGNEIKYREVLEYSSEAVASLKFVTDKSIAFDHLVPLSPALKDRKEFYGPDFSLDAYYLEKGIWNLKENIDIRNKK